MFSQSQTLSYYSKQNIIVWLTMTFQAGAINAGAFMCCHKFVTHTTGLATNIGTEFASGHASTAFGILMIPLFYLLGAMTSAYFVDYRIQTGKRPLYPIVMGFASLILTLVVLFGLDGKLATFGADVSIFEQIILLVSLSFASGLLNGTVTSASGSVIRITHMTGLTTDLGIGLVRVFLHAHKLNTRQNEIRANLVRFFIFLFFSFGAFCSTLLYLRYSYGGFVLPCALGLALFGWSILRFLRSKKSLPSSTLVTNS